MSLPEDFVPSRYRSFYKDLQNMTDASATAHYQAHGKYEGRVYTLYLPDGFDPVEYKDLHLDLQHLSDLEAAVHYTQSGRYEGRMFKDGLCVQSIPVRPVLAKPEQAKPAQAKPAQAKPAQEIPTTPPTVPIRTQDIHTIYVVIPTLKSYDVALNYILQSVPIEWKSRLILVFQKEDADGYTVCEDGHIEVRLKRNIYEYGAWVGTNMLLEKNVIPKDAWYLFVHDTCKFGSHTKFLTDHIAARYQFTHADCIWLCRQGFRNICLLRRSAITEGAKLYQHIHTMTKQEAIEGELKHTSRLSPKSLPIRQEFLPNRLYVKGKRKVYGTHIRNVENFDSIDMEKYVYHVAKGIVHPHNP